MSIALKILHGMARTIQERVTEIKTTHTVANWCTSELL
ncbi:Uncharacterised protein [Escherichia coli]|nr:Uncharacterised protein [Escherichia coli]